MVSKRWYVADFETTSERFYNEHGYTKVWLWSICDSNANIIQDGTDIEQFLILARQLCGGTIYFHNLKFDGSFIVDYLLSNSYIYLLITIQFVCHPLNGAAHLLSFLLSFHA